VSRHWSAPTVLDAEDSERLLRSLEKTCSAEEMARRVAVAKRRLAEMGVGAYSPAARAAEKQASRDRDAARLASGEVTPQQLRDENAFIRGPIRILSFGGPPRRRKSAK